MPGDEQLLDRIMRFEIDGPEPAALSFAARLAREQGWSHRFADRVIEEYKRFVYLTMIAGEPMCPSEEVDAAWHLHLTYTRSYWHRLCQETIGRPLHHEPTRGGSAEDYKHQAMYEMTLAAYRQTFGAEPPADIWPPTAKRFGPDLKHRMVNTARNWIIPKGLLGRLLGGITCGLVVLFIAPGCEGKLNPFELIGMDFVWFMMIAMAAAGLIGLGIQWYLCHPIRRYHPHQGKFNWQELALMAGGPPRLTLAAMSRLYWRQSIVIHSASGNIQAAGKPLKDMAPVEKIILDSMPIDNSNNDLNRLASKVGQAYSGVIQQLEEEGYFTKTTNLWVMRLYAMLPMFFVLLVFGAPRLILGLSRGKPVENLVETMVLGSLMFAAYLFNIKPSSSTQAMAIVEQEKIANQSLEKKGPLNDDNIALAVALFGMSCLEGSSIQRFHTWYPLGLDGNVVYGWNEASGCGSGGGCGGCGGGR